MESQYTKLSCGTVLLLSLMAAPNLVSANVNPTVAVVQPSYVDKLVLGSDLIIKGSLIDISEKLSLEGIPYTFVTYQIDDTINGRYDDTEITLKFVGGEFENGNRLSATNSPVVTLGEQAILFVQQQKDTGCDFVECEHGRMLIKEQQIYTANESAILLDGKGEVSYISHAQQQGEKYRDELTQSNADAFVQHLKQIANQPSIMGSVSLKPVVNIDKNLEFNAYPALSRAMAGPQVPKALQRRVEAADLAQKAVAGSHDAWELEQLQLNGGNPVLGGDSANK
ncbi:hypothetical protein [Shewanella waksmanii]|uniref:hypothetical protein n=1 Tax=Shewanella waksmanii TaxID=213783 RepID=UPI000490DA85|nr:hypothetical protein [Shewanella waksmanii]